MLPRIKTLFYFVVIGASFGFHPAAGQGKLDLNTVLARHAAYLKKTEAPLLQSRAVAGAVQMTVLVGGSGTLNGTLGFESEGDKRHLGMKFGHNSYDHEKIVTAGDKIWVDLVNPVRRSDLGQFLYAQDQIFKEGIFGGVLTSAWPLAQGTEFLRRMKYEGLKKVDGRELHAVRYRTEKRSGDVSITLYFDANTYSHVRTVLYDFGARLDCLHAGSDRDAGVAARGAAPYGKRRNHGRAPAGVACPAGRRFRRFSQCGWLRRSRQVENQADHGNAAEPCVGVAGDHLEGREQCTAG